MYTYEISLSTGRDAVAFVRMANSVDGSVGLSNERGLSVNGKSLLSVIWALTWENTYCQSDIDISADISRFLTSSEADLLNKNQNI